MKFALILVVFSIIIISCNSCSQESPYTPIPYNYNYSFESDMEGWEPNIIATNSFPPTWSIERSMEITAFAFALRFSLTNSGESCVWIERYFRIKPNTKVKIDIDYRFASRDWAGIDNWYIVIGVDNDSPESIDDFILQGETLNNSIAESGFEWMLKRHTFELSSGPKGRIVIFVGILGTSDAQRSYFFDDINIRFVKA